MLVKSTAFAIFSFTIVFRNVLGKPASDFGSSQVALCYSLNCPEGTTVCGKHSEISHDDKTKLNVQIRCYDEDGNILKSKNTTEENPFGPNVYYKGTKLSAVIRIIPTYLDGEDPDQEGDQSNFYPTYLNVPSEPKVKAGPKSEVEDLNSR